MPASFLALIADPEILMSPSEPPISDLIGAEAVEASETEDGANEWREASIDRTSHGLRLDRFVVSMAPE